MSRTCGENLLDVSNETVYGIVARIHIAPSSRCGMNSPPINGIIINAAKKMIPARTSVIRGRSRDQSSHTAYFRRIH